ncbi:MAG: hypothetical protein AB7U65_04240 [Halothiobacillaceae bacterium]
MDMLKRTMLLLLVLILPIQGMAGVSMSVCASGMHHAAGPADGAGHEGMSCHHHVGMTMDEAGDDASSALGDDCPHCFALSHFTARTAYDLADERPLSAPIPFSDARFASLTLDLPERPPASL